MPIAFRNFLSEEEATVYAVSQRLKGRQVELVVREEGPYSFGVEDPPPDESHLIEGKRA